MATLIEHSENFLGRFLQGNRIRIILVGLILPSIIATTILTLMVSDDVVSLNVNTDPMTTTYNDVLYQLEEVEIVKREVDTTITVEDTLYVR